VIGIASRFSEQQRSWLDAASTFVREDELRDLVVHMTAIPSPTGAERKLAEYLRDFMSERGLEAFYQRIDETQGNAVGRRQGDGTGPTLMLYAPIDAPFGGDAQSDGPWIDFGKRPDLRPEPIVDGDFVVGLCAGNPKGHAACAIMAAIALARAGVPLRGDLLVGLGSGGMPVNRSPSAAVTRANVGQGNGCSYLLEQGFRPDFAVITKPGTSIAYEEVGLCWFKLVIRGRLDYSGRGTAGVRAANHRNPILDATTVIAGLEKWFPQYSKHNTSGLVAPLGNVSAIEAGWPDRLAFIPSSCNVYLDMRVSPRTDPAEVHVQLEKALDDIRAANPQLDVTSEMILAIPGTSTNEESWIVRSAVAAWESAYGSEHSWSTGTSGATDANILRGHGIPTARIGFPRLPPNAPHNDTFSMGVASVPEMVRLTKALIAIAVDTCTRTRKDVGLN